MLVVRFLAVVGLLLVVGCRGGVTQTAAPTPVRATVTDLSVPLATNEADALVPRGFLGTAALGRLEMGCTVEVLKVTERAAQVTVIDCPASPNGPTPPVNTQGWVAKSALNL
jgi:hypothetical protein